ncbi:MAG: redoxin domain-containing protein, partial [Bacillota bacterium]
MSIYEFNVQTVDHQEQSLADYKGKVVLIVNTATKCGLKNQFSSLETLYQKYKDDGFVVLGFPSNQFLNQ